MKRLIEIMLVIVLGISVSGCTLISENYHHHGGSRGPIATFERYQPARPIFSSHFGRDTQHPGRHYDGHR
jgi:hypothetical protein